MSFVWFPRVSTATVVMVFGPAWRVIAELKLPSAAMDTDALLMVTAATPSGSLTVPEMFRVELFVIAPSARVESVSDGPVASTVTVATKLVDALPAASFAQA